MNNSINIDFNETTKEFGIITQDISLDYNMYDDNGKMMYITPFHIKEFREILRKNPNVIHCFHLVYDSNDNEVSYYFHNTKENLDELDAIMNFSSPNKIIEADVFIWKNVV